MASAKTRQLLLTFLVVAATCAVSANGLLVIGQVPETNQCHYSRAIERTLRCMYGDVRGEDQHQHYTELENVVNTGNRYDDRNINLAYNNEIISSRKSRAVVEPPPPDWRKQLTTRTFLEQDAGETLDYLLKLARDQVRNIKFRSAFRSVLPADLSDDQRRFFYILQNFKWEMRRLAERQRGNSTFWNRACQAGVQQTVIQCLKQEYYSCSAVLDAQARGGIIQVWAAPNSTNTSAVDVGTAIDLAANFYCYFCSNAKDFVTKYYGTGANELQSPAPEEFRAAFWEDKRGAESKGNFFSNFTKLNQFLHKFQALVFVSQCLQII